MAGDIEMSETAPPLYDQIYVEIITGYKDPMKNKRLKARDIHDIERLINIFTSMKLADIDVKVWPVFFRQEVLKSFYVMEYGWKMARLYLKNQRATTFNLPFIPALPSAVVRTQVVKPYKIKRVGGGKKGGQGSGKIFKKAPYKKKSKMGGS